MRVLVQTYGDQQPVEIEWPSDWPNPNVGERFVIDKLGLFIIEDITWFVSKQYVYITAREMMDPPWMPADYYKPRPWPEDKDKE